MLANERRDKKTSFSKQQRITDAAYRFAAIE
jgi:hypothetical protein